MPHKVGSIRARKARDAAGKNQSMFGQPQPQQGPDLGALAGAGQMYDMQPQVEPQGNPWENAMQAGIAAGNKFNAAGRKGGLGPSRQFGKGQMGNTGIAGGGMFGGLGRMTGAMGGMFGGGRRPMMMQQKPMGPAFGMMQKPMMPENPVY